ncbi:hypothetical protein [Thiothrix subterranea]|uniref:Uncharacterized protein n=1 Tax=Thiothrix subterranea TaxID=2735563 RepID=A0AA51R4D1_9GAMM|nr:hypothetical protein [Thiothrix subterranea]MDQ5768824.1 hypothetical protein [Thiothrix subterranea]WML86495.1 hypothetical protein RCG00_19700 [Thiothrix subterranea]
MFTLKVRNIRMAFIIISITTSLEIQADPLQQKVQDFLTGTMENKILIDSLDGIDLYEEISYDFKSDGKFSAKVQSFYEFKDKRIIIDKAVVNKVGTYSISDVNGNNAKLSLIVDGKTVSDTIKLPSVAEKLPSKIEKENLPIKSRSISIGDFELSPMK